MPDTPVEWSVALARFDAPASCDACVRVVLASRAMTDATSRLVRPAAARSASIPCFDTSHIPRRVPGSLRCRSWRRNYAHPFGGATSRRVAWPASSLTCSTIAPGSAACRVDLIQPAYHVDGGRLTSLSIASRRAKGESFGGMLLHSVWRSLILIALGIISPIPVTEPRGTHFTFEDVLTQIGLGYVLPLSSRMDAPADAIDRGGADSGWLSGNFCGLSPAAGRVRHQNGGRAGRLAAPCDGLCRSLG